MEQRPAQDGRRRLIGRCQPVVGDTYLALRVLSALLRTTVYWNVMPCSLVECTCVLEHALPPTSYHDVGSCRPAFVHSCTPRRTDAQSYRDFDFLQAVNILVTPYILISGLRRGFDETCGLLGYYAALCGNCLPTFRDHHSTLRKIAKERRSYFTFCLRKVKAATSLRAV